MFCQQCGGPLEEGARFCSRCGAPVAQGAPGAGQPLDAAAENGPTAAQEPEAEQGGHAVPQEQAAGGGDTVPQVQEAGQGGYAVPQEQTPYGGYAPPGGYPPYGGADKAPRKPMSKKAKGLMWGGIGLAVVLAIVAVLVFVVFAGGAGPLSGNTVQTRFVNEGAKVLAGAFADFSVLKMADISEQPFDMNASVQVKGGGLGTAAEADIDVAYDKLNLGAAVDIGSIRVKLLLLEDTLYVDTDYDVTGVRLNSDADLSKPMGLKQRLAALTAGKGTADTKRLAEAFLNSISADCFSKTDRAFTLELSAADVQDALEVFAGKLDKDAGLRDEMENMLEAMGQIDADIDELLEEAISSLDDADFDLTIEIRYKGGAPTVLVIEADGSGTSMEMVFGYEKKGGLTVITLDIGEGGGYDDAEIELAVKKVSGGLELSGSIESGYTSYELEGVIEKSGNTLSGSFDVSDDEDTSTLSFEYTVKPGMPGKAVEDDRRFAMDTEDADVQDLEDALGYSIPFMGSGWGF